MQAVKDGSVCPIWIAVVHFQEGVLAQAGPTLGIIELHQACRVYPRLNSLQMTGWWDTERGGDNKLCTRGCAIPSSQLAAAGRTATADLHDDTRLIVLGLPR
jgi:hypothetical protein